MRVVLIFTTMALAFGILLISVPRLTMSVHLALVDAQLQKTASLTDSVAPFRLSRQDLDVWEEARRAVAQYIEMGGLKIDLAMAQLRRASWSLGDRRQDHLAASLRELNGSVLLSPHDGAVWFRIATLRDMLGYSQSAVLDVLRASIELAPFEPSLLRARIILAFENWDDCSPYLKELTRDQIFYLISAHKLGVLEELAFQYPVHIPVLREAVENSWIAQKHISYGEKAAMEVEH